jgi:hypothetical protein
VRSVVVIVALVTGCSSPNPAAEQTPSTGAGGTARGGSAGSNSTLAGGAGGSGGTQSDSSAGTAGSAGAGGTESDVEPETIATPNLSVDAPVFSNATSSHGPEQAQDFNPSTAWGPEALPAWIAYDLSAASAEQREKVLVVWSARHAPGYVEPTPTDYTLSPLDYTIEINSAPGGELPNSGWNEVVSVTDAVRTTMEHEVELAGANWIRMTVTRSSDPAGGLEMDFDVVSAPHGATDSWLFMGDSITYMTMAYVGNDTPQRVHEARADRWPFVINGAFGGTSTTTALEIIDESMRLFPGKYVVLAYGTNDHDYSFGMEELAQKVIQAGKTPVIPHIPWTLAQPLDEEALVMNGVIDTLYQTYPEILPGPDLWAYFEDHTEWILPGDVHPNVEGQAELRKAWAAMMAEVP